MKIYHLLHGISITEHRPLGGINRIRKSVYLGISKYRHEANGVPRKEPTNKILIGFRKEKESEWYPGSFSETNIT